jgi:hypothetical protein
VTRPASDRALRGRVGAYRRWARTEDRAAATAAARLAFLRRFETAVDPEGHLPPQEREVRADFARRAYMADLSRRRVASRRRAARLPAPGDGPPAGGGVRNDQREGER